METKSTCIACLTESDHLDTNDICRWCTPRSSRAYDLLVALLTEQKNQPNAVLSTGETHATQGHPEDNTRTV